MKRRQFLTGMATLGAGAIFTGGLSAQQQGGRGGRGRGAGARANQPPLPPELIKNGRRIDVHHHYAPPGWIKVLADNKALNVEPWRDWSPAKAVEAMDRAGVATSFSSITTPGIYFAEGFGNQQAPPGAKFNNDVRALAREANEFGAKMKSDYPGRFGIWASLPLPDVDGSLKEIEYAFDKLRLDGVGLVTSIGNKYVGDASFSPVFEELNRRKVTVYTHPEVAPCCVYIVPRVGPTTLEYSQDTARTIVSWVNSGSADKFPDIQWIFSHGGGSLWSARYINGEIGTSRRDFENRKEQPRLLAHLRRYYYDTAATTNFVQMQTLKTLVGASQVLFGCDHPYGDPLDYVRDLYELQMDGTLTEAEVRGINRENALRIVPKQYA
jgi:predicted TIM-barrel fold metal-dependent hydrolase